MDFSSLLSKPLLYLFDPSKRVFFGYLISAGLLAFFLGYYRGLRGKNLLSYVLPTKLWRHPSVKVDFQFFLINLCLKSFLFSVVVWNSFDLSIGVLDFMQKSFPRWSSVQPSHVGGYLVYGLGSFLLVDFFRFFQHYCFHRVPLLWTFHQVHHSAQVLTPLTLFRTHPVESIVSAVRKIIVVGGWSGLYVFTTGLPIGGYEILGVHFLDGLFNWLGSNLRHSHVPLSYGFLERVLISPSQHQWHHKRDFRGFGENFGVILSIWDQLFGTYCGSSTKRPVKTFSDGKSFADFKRKPSLGRLTKEKLTNRFQSFGVRNLDSTNWKSLMFPIKAKGSFIKNTGWTSLRKSRFWSFSATRVQKTD